MVNINNPVTIKELRIAARIPNSEAAPTRLAESTVPTLETNPKFFRQINIVDSNTSSATQTAAVIFTTDAESITYLYGISATYVSDVTADNTVALITAKIQGGPVAAAQEIFRINKISLTATTIDKTVMFPYPIELIKGSTVLQTNTFSVGASTISTTLYLSVGDCCSN